MYVKLFASMFEGSLYGKRDQILVFTYLLAKADAEGVADLHPSVISGALGMPIADVKAALVALESPDPESRTPDEEGRRITRMDTHRDWGWRLVNYEKYRQIRHAEDRKEQNREAAKKYRQNNPQASSAISKSKRPSSAIISHHQESVPSAQAEAEADTKKSAHKEEKEDNSISVKELLQLQEVTPEDFGAKPVPTSPAAFTFGDPLEDFPEEVRVVAREIWQKFAMHHHGNALRNLHTDSTAKELRHFAKAILAHGKDAETALLEYYAKPPAKDKQLAAWQIIQKLGLDGNVDAFARGHKSKMADKEKQSRMDEILAKKKPEW